MEEGSGPVGDAERTGSVRDAKSSGSVRDVNPTGSILRRHPVIAMTVIGLTLAGAVAGGLYLDPEWSLARRVFAGAFAGAGTAILITATKMIG